MEQKQFIRYELALDCVSRTKAILAKGLQEMGFGSEAQKLKPVMIFFQKLWDSNLKAFKDKPEHIEALIALLSSVIQKHQHYGRMSFQDGHVLHDFLEAKRAIERMPK